MGMGRDEIKITDCGRKQQGQLLLWRGERRMGKTGNNELEGRKVER